MTYVRELHVSSKVELSSFGIKKPADRNVWSIDPATGILALTWHPTDVKGDRVSEVGQRVWLAVYSGGNCCLTSNPNNPYWDDWDIAVSAHHMSITLTELN